MIQTTAVKGNRAGSNPGRKFHLTKLFHVLSNETQFVRQKSIYQDVPFPMASPSLVPRPWKPSIEQSHFLLAFLSAFPLPHLDLLRLKKIKNISYMVLNQKSFYCHFLTFFESLFIPKCFRHKLCIVMVLGGIKLCNIEIHRPVGFVCISLLNYPLYKLDVLGYVLTDTGQAVGWLNLKHFFFKYNLTQTLLAQL